MNNKICSSIIFIYYSLQVTAINQMKILGFLAWTIMDIKVFSVLLKHPIRFHLSNTDFYFFNCLSVKLIQMESVNSPQILRLNKTTFGIEIVVVIVFCYSQLELRLRILVSFIQKYEKSTTVNLLSSVVLYFLRICNRTYLRTAR